MYQVPRQRLQVYSFCSRIFCVAHKEHKLSDFEPDEKVEKATSDALTMATRGESALPYHFLLRMQSQLPTVGIRRGYYQYEPHLPPAKPEQATEPDIRIASHQHYDIKRSRYNIAATVKWQFSCTGDISFFSSQLICPAELFRSSVALIHSFCSHRSSVALRDSRRFSFCFPRGSARHSPHPSLRVSTLPSRGRLTKRFMQLISLHIPETDCNH